MWESQISYRGCILGVNALGSRRGHSRYLQLYMYTTPIKIYHLMSCSSLWLWNWLPFRLSKLHSLSWSTLTCAQSHTMGWDKMDSGKKLFFVELNMVVIQVYLNNLVVFGHFPPSSFSLFFNTFALYLRYLSGNPDKHMHRTMQKYHWKDIVYIAV